MGVADVYGCRLPFGAVGKAALRVRGIDELPGNSGEDMALIVQFSPVGSFAVENLGQEDVLATKLFAALHGDSSQLGRIPQHVVADSGQSLLFQAVLDLRYGFADVGIPAVDVALVEGLASGALGVGLSDHAADELGEGDLRASVVQHHQHIGEWAVPALHEGGFGDYPSHGRELGEEIDAAQFVHLGRLDSYGLRRYGEVLGEVLADVFCVDALAVALILTSAFHADYGDRPNVSPSARFQGLRLGRQVFEFVVGSREGVLPVGIGEGFDLDGQLDHLLFLEIVAFDVDQEVADAFVWSGREFDDETGIEPVDRVDEFLVCLRLLAICLVGFVEDDDGAEHLEDVVEAVLDGPVGG